MNLPFLLLVSMFVVFPLHSRACGDERSVETAIESACRGYVQDFMDDDFDGIADRFRLPAIFEAETATLFRTQDDVVRFYKEAKANIQDGYSYSTLDSIEIRQITEQIYSADVVYRRFDANDEVIHRGRTVCRFKKVGRIWKMFLLSPYSSKAVAKTLCPA